MNSFAVIQSSVIGELFKPGQSARSNEFDGSSYFHQIARQADDLTQQVRLNWQGLSEEKRQSLIRLAEDAYSLDPKRQSFSFQKLFLRLRMSFAILRGQQDEIFLAFYAAYKLVGAVMDAIEQEETSNTMARIYLKNGQTATVPACEVDEYLQSNADKLESRIIKTRRPRLS